MTSPLDELHEVMARLRRECMWTAEQTHQTLAPYVVEEAGETVEAIDDLARTGSSAAADHLREELGDLLMQVYFHAVIAEQAGEFTLDDVAAGIVDKLKRRNPHVYGDATVTSIDDIIANWEAAKRAERSRRESGAGD